MRFQMFTRVCLITALLLSPMVAAIAQEPSPGDQAIAKVGNITITEQDYQRELQQLIPMNYSFHGGVKPETLQRLQKEARQNLVDRAYKVQYAIDEEIAIDAGKVDAEWQNYLAKNAKMLSAVSETDKTRLRAELYLDLLAEKAEQKAVDERIVYDEAAVKKYYEENKQLFVQPKLYRASHVFVKVDPASNKEEREQLQQRAETLYQRAKSGEDFYNLAYYESDDRSKYVGGKLGAFHAGQTVSEFDQALQTMKPGEISEPVKTRFGWHIIRLDDVEPERQLSYDEAAEKIKGKIKKDQRQDIYDAWMADLQKRYPLELYEK